ncbi:ABC transporter substrate-binding protein [Streptococcus loxodontisalivarius]|uniref:Iron complex transport system substrate-binding protein n=1 Tax=Streptococcus loxodontisalivarius TaxID=1349415 RepID=A0ABS2PQT5_9STRE|nr:ABC transporter substrate-binding protein [Streptococcus loxodontisalivarius]MBM7642408.1 iron complex transport system substrate-binding protein [Streptococcus loxodontisalivarius]
MKKFLTALLAIFAVVTLAACSNSSTSSSSEETTLSSKPKIEGFSYSGDIPENPKKVVNFAYSYTGYLLQLGINVSSYSLDLEKDSPAFGDKLADAKKLTSSDTETIAAEEPDLIIAFSTDENIDKLKEIAPVLEITYGTNDYLEMMTNLGKVFGKEDEAEEWLSNWKDKVADAKEELSSILPTSTTFTVMDLYDKNIYLYGNNWGRGGELIYDALGYSAPAKVQSDVFPTGYFGVSQEAIADYVGDYALLNVNDSTKEAAASLTESDVWKNMTAVKEGHIIESDYNLFYFSDPMSLDKQLDAFVSAVKKANS